ncbi:hypothetical protein B9T66_01875 [Helicobacter sp. TUL]|nr:hypothetical protein B9T66_01875 [Helicobacter sp. TUL]
MRIVKILDSAFASIDRSIELVKANLANLDELAKSVLDRAFNPLGDSTESTQNPSTRDTQSPYPLPQHWEWKTLGEMCKILNGGTPDTKNPVFWDLNQSHEVQTDKSVVGVGGEVERGEGATSQFKPLHPLAKDIETKNDDCNSTPLSQDDNSPYPLPQHWEWKTLGEICSITDGTHKTPTYVETGIPFLSVKNISKGFFDLSDVRYISQEEHNKLIKRAKPEFGDILICRIGTLGKAIKISLKFEFSIFVSLGLLKPKIKLVSDYLAHFLNSYCIEKWINDNKVGGGTHTAKLNLNVLEKCPVALPKDIKEQEQIAKHLDSTFERIKKLKELYNAQLQDYEELKQSLLTQAFSGKL